jgi:hypothetical protein
MYKYLKIFLVFSLLSVIPLILVIISNIIISDLDKNVKKIVRQILEEDTKNGEISKQELDLIIKNANIEILCDFIKTALGEASENIKKACDYSVRLALELKDYKSYAWMIIEFCFISVLIMCFLSLIANINRFFLLITFKVGLLILVITSAILVLSQSIFLALTIHNLASYFMGYTYPKLLFIICGIGVFTSFTLIINIFGKIDKKQIIIGYSVDRKEQEKLWKFVIEV